MYKNKQITNMYKQQNILIKKHTNKNIETKKKMHRNKNI